MSNATSPTRSYRFSAWATLAVIGIRLQQVKLFGPVRAQGTVPKNR